MPTVLSTITLVSPIAADVVSVVDAAVPPGPFTAVTCVPVLTPVPDIGAPNGGATPLKPIVSVPVGVINAVAILPALPLE